MLQSILINESQCIFFMQDLVASSYPCCKWYSYRLQQEGGFAKVIGAIKEESHSLMYTLRGIIY